MTSATWTNERVEKLKKLWADGLSASQVAAELGHVSRNAVIGKVHRLALPGRKTGQTVSSMKTAVRQSARPVRKPASPQPVPYLVRGNAAVRPEAEAMPAEAAAEAMPIFPRVTMMELMPSSCKWPIGDPLTPDFRFCGAKTENGAPYCTYHACMAYQVRSESSQARRATRR
ncbi:MAG: GcrA cell cycle regulator [Rhizobiales bacterium]|nr:GcrA cell cycle regulator [Hyphomicrobiales bacterium]